MRFTTRRKKNLPGPSEKTVRRGTKVRAGLCTLRKNRQKRHEGQGRSFHRAKKLVRRGTKVRTGLYTLRKNRQKRHEGQGRSFHPAEKPWSEARSEGARLQSCRKGCKMKEAFRPCGRFRPQNGPLRAVQFRTRLENAQKQSGRHASRICLCRSHAPDAGIDRWSRSADRDRPTPGPRPSRARSDPQ
jgi:hypothetical protein